MQHLSSANENLELPRSHDPFHGKIVKSKTVAGLVLSESSYLPSQRLSPHSHERAGFCLALRGGFTEDYGKGRRSCRASTLIFRPPAEVHRNHFQNSPGRCFNIELEARWMKRVNEFTTVPDVSRDYNGGLLPSLALRLYQEFRRMDEVSMLVIEGLALEMLAQLSRAVKGTSRRVPPWLFQAREVVHDHFAEGWTLAKVAEAVDVHPVHLARAFRQHYHCTVGDYLRRLRIEFACREMLSSDAPLAQISLAAGFAHQSHFSATFKRLTGTTPAEYRVLFRAR